MILKERVWTKSPLLFFSPTLVFAPFVVCPVVFFSAAVIIPVLFLTQREIISRARNSCYPLDVRV